MSGKSRAKGLFSHELVIAPSELMAGEFFYTFLAHVAHSHEKHACKKHLTKENQVFYAFQNFPHTFSNVISFFSPLGGRIFMEPRSYLSLRIVERNFGRHIE